METIDQFLDRPDIKKISKQGPKDLYSYSFNRDPNRAIYYDRSIFYAPADGFILYSKVVKPDENVVEVKGIDYSVNSLLQEKIKESCLVIGIFLTALDVHVSRIPTDGFNYHKKLMPLKANNISMRKIERAILDKMSIRYEDMEYAIYNERVVNRIFCPHINQHYWVILTADMEVDVIASFNDDGHYYTQSERFAVIRMGSQAELIIPLVNKGIEFESLVHDDILSHVEGGTDPLVEWRKRD